MSFFKRKSSSNNAPHLIRQVALFYFGGFLIAISGVYFRVQILLILGSALMIFGLILNIYLGLNKGMFLMTNLGWIRKGRDARSEARFELFFLPLIIILLILIIVKISGAF